MGKCPHLKLYYLTDAEMSIFIINRSTSFFPLRGTSSETVTLVDSRETHPIPYPIMFGLLNTGLYFQSVSAH